jgi:uncharacterized protein (DUF362 family)/Pyruvate/2-oxoacid:ferredoxin oxidoreductase delta subunit
MSTVYSQIATYDYDDLKPKLFAMMASMDSGVSIEGARVVIKPNLLAPASPGKAMLTHPLVVKAVVEYVLQKGGKVSISDSPAMGSLTRVAKESGIKAALEGMDVEYREFRSSITVDIGEPFHRIELARDAVEADILINLPKLKTHSQMLLTLGVKNLFGCVVGFRKPQWHLRAGVDRELFGLLLYRIYKALKPSFTILDGVLAMDGQGPGRGGIPREVGVIMGGRDAVALDATVCRMLGIDPDRLFTNRAASRAGEMPASIQVTGKIPSVDHFRLPEITPLVFGPEATRKYLRRYLIQRPVPDDALCKACGECWQYCPAGAIGHDKAKLRFDYEKCIRCYCCLEVCPHGALKAEEPPLGKLFNRFIKITS